MKAIVTKYLPATNLHGARIKASAEGVASLVIPYPCDKETPFAVAAVALCQRMNWRGHLIGGVLPDGREVFVFARSDRRVVTEGA